MKNIRSFAILGLSLIAALTANAQDLKIATVDLQLLFKEYHRTETAQEEINIQRTRVQKENNERLARIRDLQAELEQLDKNYNDPSISASKKQQINGELRKKLEEAKALSRERQEYLQRREAAIREKMVQQMRGILEEIKKLVEERAKADNYDYVFDKSGQSSAQVPFILYAKDAADITAGILTTLNKDAPAKWVSHTDKEISKKTCELASQVFLCRHLTTY